MSREKEDLKLAKSVYDKLCRTLDARKWTYQKQADKLRIVCSVKGDSLPIELTLKVHANRRIILLLSKIPIEAALHRRIAMVIAVSKANYRIMDGGFDYSYKNGELIFRMTLNYCGCDIGTAAMEYLIDCASHTINHFNEKFLTVAKSDMTAPQVVEYMDSKR